MRFTWFLFFLLIPNVAYAYIGPSLGLGVFGVIIGLVLAMLVWIVAIFWYPIKRLLGRKKSGKSSDGSAAAKIPVRQRRFFITYMVISVAVIALLAVALSMTIKQEECYAFLDKMRHEVSLLDVILPTGHIAKEAPVLKHTVTPEFKRKAKHFKAGKDLQIISKQKLNEMDTHTAGQLPSLSNKPINGSYYKDKYLLVTSMFDEKNGMRLLDDKGNIVNEWMFDPLALFPHKGIGHKKVDLHGAVILPDGSVIANFEYVGAARLDRCGKKMWVFPQQIPEHLRVTHAAHHVVSTTPRGTFWVAGRKLSISKHKTFNPPIKDESLIELDADGKMLQHHSLIDMFLDSHLHALLIGSSYDEFSVSDLFHVNDIEELTPAMAGAFPQFNAGDLLVSMRSPSTLIVVDGKSFKIKWFYKGSFLHQHDGDWQPDGTITLFDNQDDLHGGALYGGSRILRIDPRTYKETVVYSDGPDFYSQIRGMHEFQPDGNILITEFSRGRVFMVDPDGNILFQYVNPMPYKHSDGKPIYYEISKAEFVPKNYFTQPPVCKDK